MGHCRHRGGHKRRDWLRGSRLHAEAGNGLGPYYAFAQGITKGQDYRGLMTMTYALFAYALMGLIAALYHIVREPDAGALEYLKTLALWPVRIWRWIP